MPFWAPRYGDHYFQIQHPIEERRALFVDALDLPARMRALPAGSCLRVGETGFGTGLTCLVVLEAFLIHAPAETRLQWVSVEQHPLTVDQLTTLHDQLALPEPLKTFAMELRSLWPAPIAGGHRRHLAQGRLLLDLHLGDGAAVFSELEGRIDAWCLDGFAPSRNPEMWRPQLYDAMARLSAPGATLSSFTAATTVREGLAAAGFAVSRQTGVLGKRHRIAGHWPGQWSPAVAPSTATIVGAGLAGAFVARGLANRGYEVTVLEADTPASGASGNPQAITYTKLAVDADPSSLWQWLSLHHLHTIYGVDYLAPYWHSGGVFLEAADALSAQQQEKLCAVLRDRDHSIYRMTRDAAMAQVGAPICSDGLFLDAAGWLEPAAIVHALLDHPRIHCVPQTQVDAIEVLDEGYQWHGEQQQRRHNEVCTQLVLANAYGIRALAPFEIPLKPIRGQVTLLKDSPVMRLPICGRGYLAPPHHGLATCGATYQSLVEDRTPRDADNLRNLQEIQALLALPDNALPTVIGQRVSIRAATPDYSPVAGLMLSPERLSPDDLNALRAGRKKRITSAHHSGWAVLGGLGSRGTLTAPLLAELVVSALSGEVLPQGRTLLNAVAPERFFLKALASRQS